MKNDYGKSGNSIVPEKSLNKIPFKGIAEVMEERGLVKGNLFRSNTPRTQSRIGVSNALERVRQAAV